MRHLYAITQLEIPYITIMAFATINILYQLHQQPLIEINALTCTDNGHHNNQLYLITCCFYKFVSHVAAINVIHFKPALTYILCVTIIQLVLIVPAGTAERAANYILGLWTYKAIYVIKTRRPHDHQAATESSLFFPFISGSLLSDETQFCNYPTQLQHLLNVQLFLTTNAPNECG